MFIYAAAQVLRILHVSFLLSRHVPPSHSFNFTLIFMNTCKDKQTAFPAGNYMFKVSNRNNRTRWEICQKLTIKTAERETLNASLWCLYCYLRTYFTPFSSVSILVHLFPSPLWRLLLSYYRFGIHWKF